MDPVALGIPTYFDVVPRKDARDIQTIKQKLDADKFDVPEAFEADVELMFNNAIKFNGTESDVGTLANQLRQRFQEMMGGWRSSNQKKRKDGEQSTSQPLKKARTG